MPQQNDAAAKIEHPEKVLSVSFVADNQPAEVLQPGKESLDLPTSAVPPQSPQILGSVFTVASVQRDQFNPLVPEPLVQFVGVVSIIPDEILRRFRDDHLHERGLGQLHFMRRSTLNGYGNREAMAVRHSHDLRSLATFCFANLRSPFLAGAKLPSMKASRTSSRP